MLVVLLKRIFRIFPFCGIFPFWSVPHHQIPKKETPTRTRRRGVMYGCCLFADLLLLVAGPLLAIGMTGPRQVRLVMREAVAGRRSGASARRSVCLRLHAIAEGADLFSRGEGGGRVRVLGSEMRVRAPYVYVGCFFRRGGRVCVHMIKL